MPPQDPLDRLLDDLEGQAEGLFLADRAAEVAELGVAQYAEVTLAARWHASVGRPLRVVSTDGWEVRGQLVGVGKDWAVLNGADGGAWALQLGYVATVTGLVDRPLPAQAQPLSARLSLGSVLRQLADEPGAVGLRLIGGRVAHGRLARVGADFVELRSEGGESTVLAFAALVAVRLEPGSA